MAGVTSRVSNQRAKRWISSSTISWARVASTSRPDSERVTAAWRSSMSYSVTPGRSAQSGSTSRGTARSISISGRWARARMTTSSSSCPRIG